LNYEEFLNGKAIEGEYAGFEPPELHAALFPFQAAIVGWALRKGRAAIFADTGLGKTIMQLEWARQVNAHSGRPVLVLAPLAVAEQTVREARKLGVAAGYARHQRDANAPVVVTNYEMLDHFNPSEFSGVVLDESSILKNHTGATRDAIISAFERTPFKLACTATPAPNDHMELGNHAEFLGVMTRVEMLAMYFVHDGGETSKWRLKGHAGGDFWEWVSTWAAAVKTPADIGHEMSGYDLPGLELEHHIVGTNFEGGDLFGIARTLQEQRAARRLSIPDRVNVVAELVAAEPAEPWVIWCDLNDESAAAARAVSGAVELTGSDTREEKTAKLEGFSNGSVRVLVTKPSIAGFGLNWQHCARTAFLGVGHSFEMFYQSVRRFHRFGQTRPVRVHVVSDVSNSPALDSLARKQAQADEMTARMVGRINAHSPLNATPSPKYEYNPTLRMVIPEFVRSEK